jgi:parvulin-like peptidyl-prolyl isomerase
METVDERRKRALDGLVLLELAYQRATAAGIKADDLMVQTGIDNFKINVGGEAAYNEYLKKLNMTDAEVRTDVERRITINLIYTREVVDRVMVPEDELQREYEKEKRNFVQPEKVAVVDVFLVKNEGKASKKKAEDLLDLIKSLPNQDPWKLTLDGMFIVRNLAINKNRDRELYNAAKKLEPFGISGVIDTPSGPHIIKLKEYSPEKQLSFDEAKPALIARLNGPYLEKRTHAWEEELKAGATIVLLDAATSQKTP